MVMLAVALSSIIPLVAEAEQYVSTSVDSIAVRMKRVLTSDIFKCRSCSGEMITQRCYRGDE